MEQPAYDLVFRTVLSRSHVEEVYGAAVYCSHKRQLSHAELRRYGLQNTSSEAGIHSVLGNDLLWRIQYSRGNPIRPRL